MIFNHFFCCWIVDVDNSCGTLLEQFGFKLAKIIDQCPNCYTVSDFAYDHPLGDYILGPKEHAVAVINGNWYDTWDSGDMVPTYYFRRS